ncbi:hypothetical protein ACSZNJ_20390 [Aeromonas hydrophila]
MARIINYQLSNAKGLLKVVILNGLEHKVVIHPTVYGEPLLTTQAFYYLEDLDSVAKIRYENEHEEQNINEIEYMIDNYLYEYSKTHPNSRITTKTTEYKYWLDDPHELYSTHDNRNTQALVLDIYNDESVKDIKDDDECVGFDDFLIFNNYFLPIFEEYINSLKSLLDKKVFAEVMSNVERDGYIGKLRIVKPSFGLIDYHQSQRLDWIDIRDISFDAKHLDIQPACSQTISELDIETITTSRKLNPIMLSYYFSGLRENHSTSSFIGYYNVLEHYFEEAPLILHETAKSERKQLECVINMICSLDVIKNYITALTNLERTDLSTPILTSTNINIDGLNFSSIQDTLTDISRWIYDIRCAIVHSKKTRNKKTVACFEPYSHHVDNIKHSLPLMRWLACLCIDKDYELNNPQQS